MEIDRRQIPEVCVAVFLAKGGSATAIQASIHPGFEEGHQVIHLEPLERVTGAAVIAPAVLVPQRVARLPFGQGPLGRRRGRLDVGVSRLPPFEALFHPFFAQRLVGSADKVLHIPKGFMFSSSIWHVAEAVQDDAYGSA